MKISLNISLISFLATITISNAQTDSKNYIQTFAYRVPTTDGNVAIDDITEIITYYDGLGRSIQRQALRVGGNRENLITPIIYDEIGRQTKEYLPLPISDLSGDFYDGTGGLTIDQELKNYYKAKFPDDFFQGSGNHPDWDNPFTETIFEESPRSRPIEQAFPGFDWKAHYGNEHTKRLEYGLNTSPIPQFSANFIGGDYSNPQLAYENTYPLQSLYVTIAKDENWEYSDGIYGKTFEFTNKSGQVVLRRTTVFDPTKGPQDPNYHDTYFVYDDYGNLSFVLSPEASDHILSGGVIDQLVLYNHVYQYKYDGLNRLIEKKLPGKGWEYLIYDSLDRIILSQDPNLRVNDQWLFTKYDIFGREAYSGIYNPPAAESRSSMQQLVETAGLPLTETQITSYSSIGDTDVYYTNLAYPNTNLEVLSINYFDTYADQGNLSLPTNVYGLNPSQTNTKGLSTVSKVRVLNSTNWITGISGYDEKGRVVYTASENEYLNTTETVKVLLNHIGNVEERTSTHFKLGTTTITIKDYFTYDQFERVRTHEQKIDNEPVQLIVQNYYDDLGQLVQKDVGGETFVDGYTAITDADVTFDGKINRNTAGIGWTSGVKTKGEIIEDGGIKFTVNQDDKIIRVGLEKTGGLSLPTWSDFDYGVHLLNTDTNFDGQNDVKLVINNSLGTIITGYQSGDSFSIERINGQIIFKKNGAQLGVPINDSSGDTMVGKASFYSSFGQIEGLELFGSNIDKKLQNVNFTYNVRGWITDINDVESSGLELLNTDLFNFRINYNNLDTGTGTNPLYDGNISQTMWNSEYQDTDTRSYIYSYDNLYRIKSAISLKGTDPQSMINTNNHDVSNISFDKNGNILTLKRRGKHETNGVVADWDDLVYTYNGNELVDVDDNAISSPLIDYGFRDVNTGPLINDFEYDQNGNMNKDRNKGVASITYNHLNLPVEIVFDQLPRRISYIYSADGTKLSKSVIDEGNITTEYSGNFIYNNAETGIMKLQAFFQPEGYIEPVANSTESVKGFDAGTGTITYSSYNYIFQYKDHLGNVRLSYSDLDKDGSIISPTEIIEESNFYPFGLKHNGYNRDINPGGNGIAQLRKFQGQEFQDDFNLNWYFFKWRNSDPALGRFYSLDPLSEKFYYNSPYAFSENKVIGHFEMEGLESIVSITMGSDIRYRGDIVTAAFPNALHFNINITSQGPDDFVNAFISASQADPKGIGFVSIWGHGRAGIMYGDDYGSIEITTSDLDKLNEAIVNGDIKFAENATIYIGNCNSGTCPNFELMSLAQKLAEITGAKVIGANDSVGLGVPANPENTTTMEYVVWDPKNKTFIAFYSDGTSRDLGPTIDVITLMERFVNTPTAVSTLKSEGATGVSVIGSLLNGLKERGLQIRGVLHPGTYNPEGTKDR